MVQGGRQGKSDEGNKIKKRTGKQGNRSASGARQMDFNSNKEEVMQGEAGKERLGTKN